ncbi:MAG: hypothetical protein LAN62_17135 [Acidobacteriia bacterium]|nr:hypothetical protein [Terriglobia bacterium]
MSSFSGKFRYAQPGGSPGQAGACQVSFDEETLTLIPQGGPPITFDLGDIDAFTPGEYDLTLALYTGNKVTLEQFGKAFQNLRHDLLEAYRQRLVECLLLEDLEEIARFEGFAWLDSPRRTLSSPAEFRLYRSNLAILPTQTAGFQWRLANIDAIDFNEASYTVTLRSEDESLSVTKLAKRTREFQDRLREAMTRLSEQGAQALHRVFPFLTPNQFQQVAQLMKEGRAAALSSLKAIHPQTEKALAENVVDAKLRPYFKALLSHVPPGMLYAGFKLIREEPEEEPETPTEEAEIEVSAAATGEAPVETTEPSPEETATEDEEEEEPVLHWFFFPLASEQNPSQPGNVVAWETTSRGGRATYFFRIEPSPVSAGATPLDAAIRELNRAIVLLNFRREPIYLPDDTLTLQPRYRRHVIACRKIPELRRLRASFLGRAIHTSLAVWQKQVDPFLAKS